MITEGEQSKGGFTLVDGANSSTPSKPEFQNVSHKDAHGMGDSLSSIKGGEDTIDGRAAKKGLTREQANAHLGLKIKPAQLLDTGEILLGNGKIIGTRALKYIYKQRWRLPDNREAVVVNKLSLEYRRLRAITAGGEEEAFKGRISQEVINSQVAHWKHRMANDLKVGMKKGNFAPRPQM